MSVLFGVHNLYLRIHCRSLLRHTPGKMPASIGKTKIAAKRRRTKLKIKNFDFAPLEELDKALTILNTDHQLESENENQPLNNCCKKTRRKPTDVAHLCNLHYCTLIKRAALEHNWKDVLKLLLAYIEEPKSDVHNTGAIFKFTFIHLLNDPVARSLNIMDEFLQLALSCQTQLKREEFLKQIMSIRNGNKINKQNL